MGKSVFPGEACPQEVKVTPILPMRAEQRGFLSMSPCGKGEERELYRGET